ncbi:MAG TPA: GNAT family N-acetyltransferase, partial [Candidatus Dormibacteraeota bacterium]|nr:GNAT family N-acetyltransferase [Candidatus Dormibacteraeota bacterium]
MVQLRQEFALEMMRESDVSTVQEIEREIFATPWPRNAYYRELASRASAHYVVLRQEGLTERPSGYRGSDFDPTILGYGGMWRMYDEAHVTTIGVRRDLQHRGYGRIIFAGLVQAAYDMGAKWVTLEVRTTNENAMKMYEGFGF